ncbi:VOC family protein [Brucella lupini]|uniref:Glyoxalase/Bleomycin resistance /Dioxygenase superfamily protein n=1 Tax=Brucella lupini TaxID=255457 RepID=A0A256GZG4_9HYPH|nr:VOC family protein [Brucella lupini]KAB2703233.1 VOC family protein [Brucella lupini]OYR32519.1 glyoxalase/Bleomycin resistance /Dioxygenase superfamily protein [Brucella lupini]
MNPVFEKLHHICLVVQDIDKTQAYYESIGVGPWIAYPPLIEYTDLNVPNPVAFGKMQYRICNLPNIQLQLCQPSEDPCPQRTFLEEKGEGVFHLGFEVPDADAAESEAGIPVKMSGRRENRTGFTYFDTADVGGVVLLTRSTNRPGT